ncbi:MAG: methylated-DNA--[protein]-cysteine S-methyltransferase [Bacteroidota bacterium]|nr:methylated-DNA--[protein]-cysteine S-methyltransferase [Bacteroidota bacterium]
MDNLFLSKDVMINALLNRDRQFEGQFIIAVKTTGIFCRPGCTARMPKKENVEFFDTTKAALANGYRPCKVCRPLEKSGEVPEEIKGILNDIEINPSEKITDYGLVKKGIEPSRVRRWFLKNHGMTFQSYQRLLRINNAFNDIKNGDKVIEAAYENGYDSLSGFSHTFKKATSINPKDSVENNCLTFTRFTTPLGPMMAVASEDGICMFDFTDRRMLETELTQIQKHFKSSILPGKSKYFEPLKKQIDEYFAGTRKTFDIPLVTPGTKFQNEVWKVLQTIPYAQTRSYKAQAIILGNVKAVRAVANANGDNRISIIIPCHRVIGEDGKLVGYGGGLWRKQWLLNHEKSNLQY